MSLLHVPWLELAIAVPLAGAALVARCRDAETARRWCLVVASIAFACTVGAWCDFLWLATPLAHDPGGLSALLVLSLGMLFSFPHFCEFDNYFRVRDDEYFPFRVVGFHVVGEMEWMGGHCGVPYYIGIC
jgi:hypothetical protein